MAITQAQLRNEIHIAGFPMGKREEVFDVVWRGILLFREYKVRRYRSHTGKLIQKPTPTHNPLMGRHNQTGARTVLVSSLARAWLHGFGRKATLNHRNKNPSLFEKFATSIMAREGIGNATKHLSGHWSIRRKIWLRRQNWRVSGGIFT